MWSRGGPNQARMHAHAHTAGRTAHPMPSSHAPVGGSVLACALSRASSSGMSVTPLSAALSELCAFRIICSGTARTAHAA